MSSRNARKHGLFGADAVSGPISPTMVAVFEELAQGNSALAWQREVATVAALRLSRANALVRHLQAELAASVLDHSLSSGYVGELIGSLARMQRHARRFRGQRDRALRKALGRAPVSPSHPAELENAVPPEPT